MAQTTPSARETASRSGDLAVGVTYFAGVMLVLNGILQVINGIAAIATDNLYVSVNNYWLSFNLTAWGWIHLIVGALAVIAGFGIFARTAWAYVLGVMLAALSLVINFAFLPYYPIWALLVIALDVLVIWALSRTMGMAR